MLVNQKGLQIVNAKNQTLPEEGPKTVPYILNFAVAASYDFDLEQMQNQGFFSMLQTVFVDTISGNAAPSVGPTTITVTATGQVLTIKNNACGYYPIVAPNPVRLSIANASGSDVIKIQLINVAIAPLVWSPT